MESIIPNIIHNPDRLDRLTILKKELENQGIEHYRLWDSIHDETSVVKGINLAHKQIVQFAKDEGLEEVLIWEDDIKFYSNKGFEYYLKNKPTDYDIYLGGIFLGEIKEGKVDRFTALHCYIVHNRFYDTFLNTPDNIHLDAALADVGKYVVCEPMVCAQHNGYSQNSNNYCNFDVILSQRTWYNA